MNCVGIDVSKGKSMIAGMRPFGEVVVSPFEVLHTDNELSKLAELLKSLDGETRLVMEATGNYHAPVAWLRHDAGLYAVSYTHLVSACYSIWFLRESRFRNYPRMLLRTNCAISGTGFLVSSRIIEENGGWPYFLLTEDIEFSVCCALDVYKRQSPSRRAVNRSSPIPRPPCGQVPQR